MAFSYGCKYSFITKENFHFPKGQLEVYLSMDYTTILILLSCLVHMPTTSNYDKEVTAKYVHESNL